MVIKLSVLIQCLQRQDTVHFITLIYCPLLVCHINRGWQSAIILCNSEKERVYFEVSVLRDYHYTKNLREVQNRILQRCWLYPQIPKKMNKYFLPNHMSFHNICKNYRIIGKNDWRISSFIVLCIKACGFLLIRHHQSTLV